MNLRINNTDPRLIEDDNGNEMFRYVGIHLQDVEWLARRIDSLEEERDDLERRLENTQDQLSKWKARPTGCVCSTVNNPQ